MDMSTLVTVICSGAFLAFLEFLIQFFVTRKDTKEKEAKEEKKEEAKEAKDDRFDKLEKQFQEGLKQREEAGKSRYEEHKQAIADMSHEHKEDFKQLVQAIEQLKDNDTEVAKALTNLSDTQAAIAEGIRGLAHDKIIFLTDKIIDRKYITLKEKATIESVYQPYVKLQGNGQCKTAYEHVMTLPVISEEQAKKMDEDVEALRNGTYFGKK